MKSHPNALKINRFFFFDLQGETSIYANQNSYECLPCAEGCDACKDASPCVAALNWPMRTIILALACAVIGFLPPAAWFTFRYQHVKVWNWKIIEENIQHIVQWYKAGYRISDTGYTMHNAHENNIYYFVFVFIAHRSWERPVRLYWEWLRWAHSSFTVRWVSVCNNIVSD